LVCAVPIIQLAAFTLVYKLTAGLIQPICDERIVKAVNAAGSLVGLMLGVCVLLSVTFVFSVIIVLSL
jgi:stage III sporulation protein AE